MTKAERVSAVAARAANPEDVEAGQKQVNDIAAALVLRWRIFLIIRTFFGAISVPVAAALTKVHPEWSVITLVATAIIIFICIFSGHYIQTRKRFFVGQNYDAKLPEGVEHLLAELAAGRMEARLSKEDGLASAGALRTPDGALLDRIITRTVFARRYAPMLLSSTAKSYDDFWMPWGEKLNGAIYAIIPEVVEQAEDEAALPEPDKRHWIAKIPSEQFPAWVDSVIARWKWTGPEEEQMRIVLQAAYRFATRTTASSEGATITDMADACIMELQERGFKPELRYGEKADAPIARESLLKLFGSGTTHIYRRVRESAEAITAETASGGDHMA